MRILNGPALAFFLCYSASFVYSEPTLQSIIDAIQANAEKRAELLKHSSGACTVRLQREVAEDRPAEKLPFSMDNFHFDPNHTAKVTWMQRGDLLRFDVVIPEPSTPASVWSPFPPQNTRTLLDGHRSVTYDVTADSVFIDTQPPASVNPIAILYRFEPELLYRFRGYVLHEMLKELLEQDRLPKISEVHRNGQRLLELKFTWKRGDHGRDREGVTQYVVAPDQGYSLVEGLYSNRFFDKGAFSTETFERFDGTYVESPEHPGIWLLSHLRHLTDTSGTLDAVEVTFKETRVSIDSADSNFTEEGLGIKDGTPRVDRRVPSTGTAEGNP